MRSTVPRGPVRGLSIVVVAVLAALALVLPAIAGADPTPEYFPLPEARPIGGGMSVDSSGNIWFGVQGPTTAITPSLARLTPAALSPETSNGIEYFPTPEIENEPCCAKLIRDVTFDPVNDRVWFAASTGAIGYGVPSLMSAGASSGIQVATTPGFPNLGGIAVDPSGIAWFTENSSDNVPPAYAGNRVAHTDGSLAIQQYPDLWHQPGNINESRYDAEPAGITIGKEGSPWFAEASAGLPGYRLAKAIGGEYQEYLLAPCEPRLPCSGSDTGRGPVSVATAPDGSIWFTNLLKNTFGKLDPGTGTITQYSLPGVDSRLAGGEPLAIRAAPDGTLWLAERGFISHPLANALVRIVPTDPPTATVYELGSGRAPISLAPDSSGNVWFGVADTTPSAVGRLAGVVGPPSGSGSETAPGGDSSTSTPGGGSSSSSSSSSQAQPPPGEIVVHAGTVGTAKVGETQVKGDSLSVNQICIGPPSNPCAVVYLLTAGEYVTGFPGTRPRAFASRAGGRKVRSVVVGSKAVSVPGGSSAKVVVKLNAKGRKILKRDGVLHVTLHVSQKLKKGKAKVLRTKKVTFTAPKK
jgi:streptogramin lyase